MLIKLVFILRPQVFPRALNPNHNSKPNSKSDHDWKLDHNSKPDHNSKTKTPFGNITAPTDETPENNKQSTQNRSTPDAQQEEIKKNCE